MSYLSLLSVKEKTAFYDLVDKDMDGNPVKMDTFKGDVLCLVNVASKWGLTKTNYVQFSKLYDEYAGRGFKILAFPCNQFGGQEPVRFFACKKILSADFNSHISSNIFLCVH